jgi:hypothetical protein
MTNWDCPGVPNLCCHLFRDDSARSGGICAVWLWSFLSLNEVRADGIIAMRRVREMRGYNRLSTAQPASAGCFCAGDAALLIIK